MKTEIEISNGGGWNNYPALRNLTMPREVRTLLKTNKIVGLFLKPYSDDKPFGIGAFFYRATYADERGDYEPTFTLRFDQNATQDKIRAGVLRILTEGIDAVVARREREIAAVQDAEAQAKGFSNYAAYDAALKKQAEDSRLERDRFLNDPANAKAAVVAMILAIGNCTTPPALMTRKGKLLDAQKQPVGTFTQIREMGAWLYQHGHGKLVLSIVAGKRLSTLRPTVDDRQHLFDYVRNLSHHERLQFLSQ